MFMNLIEKNALQLHNKKESNEPNLPSHVSVASGAHCTANLDDMTAAFLTFCYRTSLYHTVRTISGQT